MYRSAATYDIELQPGFDCVAISRDKYVAVIDRFDYFVIKIKQSLRKSIL